ncbi:MAG: hypothetical protein HYR85_13940 [Planctomycetes bacterium]|nr:hypothetical protein [Planctomycetota bacterium]
MTARFIAATFVAVSCMAPAFGQSRRSYSIDSLLGSRPQDAASAEVKMRPIEAWLEQYVPKKCAGVQRVEFRRTTDRTYTSQAATETSRTEMEVSGLRDDFSDSVAAILSGLAEQSDRAITVDVRIVESRGASSQAQRPAAVDWLTAADLSDAIGKLADDSSRQSLSAPKLTVLQAMEAEIEVGSRVGYIKDWTLVESGDSQIAEPDVDVLHEGIRVKLVPILHPAGKTMTLSMSVTISDLVRPIPKVDVDLGGKTVQRDVPELRTVQWNSGMLDLPEDVRSFRVHGLRRIDAKTGIPHDVELLVHVDVGNVPNDGDLGSVIAVAGESRTVIVETRGGQASLRPGAHVQVVRNGAFIATIVVERRDFSLAVTRVIDGELPAPGDGVR